MISRTRIIESAQERTEEEKAELAALIFNEMNPTGDNIARFFKTLADIHHDELVNRAAGEKPRD